MIGGQVVDVEREGQPLDKSVLDFIHEMKMNNDYQIKGRCSLYTSLFLIGMDIYFSSSLRAYVSILPSTLLSCLIILMRE